MPKNYKSFYAQVFQKSNKKCAETGEKIYAPMLWNFHHVLPKKLFPEFAEYEGNFIILGLQAHDQWEIASWEKRKQMRIWAQCQKIAKELLNELQDSDKRKQDYTEWYELNITSEVGKWKP